MNNKFQKWREFVLSSMAVNNRKTVYLIITILIINNRAFHNIYIFFNIFLFIAISNSFTAISLPKSKILVTNLLLDPQGLIPL